MENQWEKRPLTIPNLQLITRQRITTMYGAALTENGMASEIRKV